MSLGPILNCHLLAVRRSPVRNLKTKEKHSKQRTLPFPFRASTEQSGAKVLTQTRRFTTVAPKDSSFSFTIPFSAFLFGGIAGALLINYYGNEKVSQRKEVSYRKNGEVNISRDLKVDEIHAMIKEMVNDEDREALKKFIELLKNWTNFPKVDRDSLKDFELTIRDELFKKNDLKLIKKIFPLLSASCDVYAQPIENRDIPLIRALKAAGIPLAENKDYSAEIIEAIKINDQVKVKVLLGVGVNSAFRGPNGETFWHYAVRNPEPEKMIDLLSEYFPELVYVGDNKGQPPLFDAIRLENRPAVERLFYCDTYIYSEGSYLESDGYTVSPKVVTCYEVAKNKLEELKRQYNERPDEHLKMRKQNMQDIIDLIKRDQAREREFRNPFGSNRYSRFKKTQTTLL